MFVPVSNGCCQCWFGHHAPGKCFAVSTLQHAKRKFSRQHSVIFGQENRALAHDDKHSRKLRRLRRSHVRTVFKGWLRRSANS